MPGTPGANESASVVAHGPAAFVEKVPLDELERSVTETAGPVVTGVPEDVVSETVDAAEGVPAVTVCVGGAMVSSGCVQVRNDRQAALWLAPGMSTLQSVSWPGGPQAPVPEASGSVASPDAWIAAASRSRS